MKAVALLLATAGAVLANSYYTYSYFTPANGQYITSSDLSQFAQNGTGGTPGGWWASSPASLVLKNNSNYTGQTDYEVSMTLTLASPPYASGTFVQLVRASSNAISNGSGAGQGNYVALELSNPTFASDGTCSAYLTGYARAGSYFWAGGNTPVPCAQAMTMRTVVFGSTVWTMILGQVYGFTIPSCSQCGALASGAPGVGAYGSGGESLIGDVQIGPRSLAAPAAIPSQNFSSSVYYNSASFQWTEPVDTTGVGIESHGITRINGSTNVPLSAFDSPNFADTTVAYSTTYTYQFCDVSFTAYRVPVPLLCR